jgi:HD-GYP domain-containing protein (c-di-GMP phosphodiesterase class II)
VGDENAAQNTATNLINVLGQSDELLRGIFDHKIDEESKSNDALMQRHSVNTSSLCISFAEYLKLDKSLVEFLGVAGLFHDIAYSQYDEQKKALFFKPMKEMEAAELTEYKEHPKVGSVILQDKDFASKEVIDLVLSHEEKKNGNGFPNKLTQLTPAQEVMSICAFYDREVTCLGKTRAEVLDDFNMNQLGNYELDIMKKFKAFVKKAGL